MRAGGVILARVKRSPLQNAHISLTRGDATVVIEQRDAPEPAKDAAPSASPVRPRLRWIWRFAIAAAIALYYTLWGLTAFDKVNPTDLDVFFLPAVKIALAGKPLDVYSLRVGLIYPNANGPLSLLPLTLAAWIAQSHGWLNDVMLRRMLVFVISAIFPLLVGWEAARAVDRFGPPLRGRVRALIYLPILLTPLLWLDALYYGHIEQSMVVWLALAASRLLATGRYAWGGALLGLALLARSDAILIVLALTLTLLVWRRWRGLALTLLATGGAFLLGLAPFLLADWHDVTFSLFTFRTALPVGGGDLWSLSTAPIVVAIAQQLDAGVTLAFAALLILIAHVARPDLDLDSPDIYGLLALASFCFSMLIKTLWPYYFLESALFATVWVFTVLPRRNGRLAIPRREWVVWGLYWLAPLAISACAIVAEAGLETNNYNGWVRPWTQVNIACLLMTLAIILLTLIGGGWERKFAARRDAAPRGILPVSAPDVAVED
jgi:hypothetical protein